MGRHEDAIETCRSGLLRHPAYLSARVTLGRALIETGDYDAAREELETVLRSAPENLAAIRGLAQIKERLGESTEMDPHLAALMNAEVERISLAATARPAPPPEPAVEPAIEPALEPAVEPAVEPPAPVMADIVEAAAEMVLEDVVPAASFEAAPAAFAPEADAEPASAFDLAFTVDSALAFDPSLAFDPAHAFDLAATSELIRPSGSEPVGEPAPAFEAMDGFAVQSVVYSDGGPSPEEGGPDPEMIATLARLERFLVAIDAARHP